MQTKIFPTVYLDFFLSSDNNPIVTIIPSDESVLCLKNIENNT